MFLTYRNNKVCDTNNIISSCKVALEPCGVRQLKVRESLHSKQSYINTMVDNLLLTTHAQGSVILVPYSCQGIGHLFLRTPTVPYRFFSAIIFIKSFLF